MRELVRRTAARIESQRGASLAEYVLLVAFIAVAALLAVAFFGTQLGSSYSSIASEYPS